MACVSTKTSIRPAGGPSGLLICISLAAIVAIHPARSAMAAGLSIMSTAERERTQTGHADESSEERFEESEEEREGGPSFEPVVLSVSVRSVLLERGKWSGPSRPSDDGASAQRAHSIRGPPLR